jgi:hypothetical protein
MKHRTQDKIRPPGVLRIKAENIIHGEVREIGVVVERAARLTKESVEVENT